MDNQVEVLVGIAAAVLVAVLAVVASRRRRHRRALGVDASAKKYLSGRYGELPKNLTVNCSDDTHWPVLVVFDHPKTGARHRLQFGVCERDVSLSLHSETVDKP